MRFILLALTLLGCSTAMADAWKSDPVWHDGLVEKATYSASREIYGQPRPYTAIFFTNKEQHDRATLTKATDSKDTVEVWKHNQIEVIPTPNYDYKFETTSHLSVEKMELTRLDCSSQEFCGTSFKQFLREPTGKELSYWSFSYMPESGRVSRQIKVEKEPMIPQDALPLWLRDYDFNSRQPARFWMLPSQKSNRATGFLPVAAEARFAGEDGDAYKLEVVTFAPTRMAGSPWDQPSRPVGTFWMDKQRLHVMTKYHGADGQTYELKSVERVDYWTIKGQ